MYITFPYVTQKRSWLRFDIIKNYEFIGSSFLILVDKPFCHTLPTAWDISKKAVFLRLERGLKFSYNLMSMFYWRVLFSKAEFRTCNWWTQPYWCHNFFFKKQFFKYSKQVRVETNRALIFLILAFLGFPSFKIILMLATFHWAGKTLVFDQTFNSWLIKFKGS